MRAHKQTPEARIEEIDVWENQKGGCRTLGSQGAKPKGLNSIRFTWALPAHNASTICNEAPSRPEIAAADGTKGHSFGCLTAAHRRPRAAYEEEGATMPPDHEIEFLRHRIALYEVHLSDIAWARFGLPQKSTPKLDNEETWLKSEIVRMQNHLCALERH